MKLKKLNAWMTLAANLGVIAGIVFLAFEIRQNNELLAVEARAVGEENRMRDELLILENADLRDVLIRANRGEELTAEELLLLRVFQSTVMNGWQATWLEYEAGLIDIDGYTDRWRNLFWFNEYSGRWEETKHRYRADFELWMDENVVHRPPANYVP